MKSNKYTDKYNLYWFLTFIYSTFSGKIFKNNPFNSLIKIGLVDPMGAALYSYFVDGVLSSNGSSITEGIGQGRITENLTLRDHLRVVFFFV